MLGGGGGDGGLLARIFYKHAMVSPKPGQESAAPLEKLELPQGLSCLPASHVIHTVGPVYRPGTVYPPANNPEVYLSSAYRNSLSIAKAHTIQYVAFPPISCGPYGYPYDEAAEVSLSTIKESVNDIKEVHSVHKSEVIYNVCLEKAEKLLKA